MQAIDKLGKQELKEILNKCWMTHDAMWFLHCLQECGIEKTNKINLAAIKAIATIEIQRAKKALGIESVETFKELRELLEGAVGIFKGDFIKLTYNFPSENLLCWDWAGQECFAYAGIKGMGVIEQYQCGVIYRIECWLDSLEVEYSITPQVKGCLMHTDGNCSGEFRFFFGE